MTAIDMRGYGADVANGEGSALDENPFDLLSPEEFEELQLEAEASPLSPPEESEETVAEEAAETSEEQVTEAEAGTEMHTPEQMSAIAEQACEDIGGFVTELEQLAEQADINDDSDPKGIAKLLKEIEGLYDDAESAKESAMKAVSADDVGAAAEAAAECERLCTEAEALVEEAVGMVGTAPPPSEPVIEEKVGAKPASAPKAPSKGKPSPALAIWAKHADA